MGWALSWLTAGWLQTVQSYYDTAVHSILDTVVDSLNKDPSLRFIWSEIKWFQMWWPAQTADTQVCERNLRF